MTVQNFMYLSAKTCSLLVLMASNTNIIEILVLLFLLASSLIIRTIQAFASLAACLYFAMFGKVPVK